MNLAKKKKFLDFFLSNGIFFGCHQLKGSFPLEIGKKNRFLVFNLQLILKSLLKVAHIFKEISICQKPLHLLIINSNPEFDHVVQIFAEKLRQSYINNRWIGGTLTNWQWISQGVYKFHCIAHKFPKYSAKSPKYQNLERTFIGVKNINQKPDIILLTDATAQSAILFEAHLSQIPVIAFVDSKTNNNLITYPIYGNNKSFNYFQFCLNLFLKISTKHKKS